MSLRVSARIARRELRGGLRAFWVFLTCLALGVGAIAAVGSVRSSIETGLAQEGAVLLGGDAEIGFTYRFADDTELAWMEERSERVSEIVDFRSMATSAEDPAERALSQVKGVDSAYPLKGSVGLSPDMSLRDALAEQDGLPGGVMAPNLADRLGLEPGDAFRVGGRDFRLGALLVSEPDRSAEGFGYGPRTIVGTEALREGGLLAPGTLYDTRYRLELEAGTNLEALELEAQDAFGDTGMRWRDSRSGAPQAEQFVGRIGAFLVLVGLAGLAVGGVGVSAAVRAYLDRKTEVIATLKSLGAEGRTIFSVYLMQIGLLTLLGVAIGVVIGAGVPLLLAPLIEARLPLPAVIGLYPGPLAEAALYGILTALVFTLWPLAVTEQVRAATLFRGIDSQARALPRPVHILTMLVILTLLIGMATWMSGVPRLALATAGGIIVALGVLVLSAIVLRRLAGRAARSRAVRGRTGLRAALAAIGGPREEAASVILSLGLGLTVLASVGQIDSNLRAAIERDLPDRAPSFFFVDIQNQQLDGFLERTGADPLIEGIETAPMLRGFITRINGEPARDVAGEHWTLRGDRGVTYADRPPEGTTITEGEWWPEGYDGPPLVSFSADAGEGLGLEIGDAITVNILGRDITAEIANFREVDFRSGGIGFIMTMNPGALAAAPHSHIATLHIEPAGESALLRDLAQDFPNITAVSVRDAIDQVSAILAGIAAATSYAAAATLLTGFVVLIGSAAAGERARVYESAILKTLGATRLNILASFALRSAMLGAAAGVVAIIAGGVAGWAVMTFVMRTSFEFEPFSALAIVIGGVVATLLAGLAFALRPLSARPAQVLRAQD